MITLKKTLLITAFAAAVQVLSAASASALPCDSRGSNWQGRIQIGTGIWGFELRRQTCAPDSLWNYYVWSNTARYEGQATVAKSGSAISVATITGGIAGCSLNGTYRKRDVHNARPYRGDGAAFCGGSGITGTPLFGDIDEDLGFRSVSRGIRSANTPTSVMPRAPTGASSTLRTWRLSVFVTDCDETDKSAVYLVARSSRAMAIGAGAVCRSFAARSASVQIQSHPFSIPSHLNPIPPPAGRAARPDPVVCRRPPGSAP